MLTLEEERYLKKFIVLRKYEILIDSKITALDLLRIDWEVQKKDIKAEAAPYEAEIVQLRLDLQIAWDNLQKYED